MGVPMPPLVEVSEVGSEVRPGSNQIFQLSC